MGRCTIVASVRGLSRAAVLLPAVRPGNSRRRRCRPTRWTRSADAPLCASATQRAIASPSPAPPPPRAGSSRTNRSKTRSRSSAGCRGRCRPRAARPRPAAARQGDVDRPAARRVRQRVAEQVGEHPPKQRLVPVQRHGLKRRADCDARCPPADGRSSRTHSSTSAVRSTRADSSGSRRRRRGPGPACRRPAASSRDACCETADERLAILPLVTDWPAQRDIGGRAHDRDRVSATHAKRRP